MAGDWLKIESGTPDKPEVIGIADSLGITPAHSFGCLFMVWRWFDQHTTSGNAPFVTKVTIDRLAGVAGFADAMIFVGWLEVHEGGSITLPNFSRHNGETAKQRALTAKRVSNHKQKSNATSVSKVTDDALPREEKRREDSKPPSKERGEVNGTTEIQNGTPPPSRKGIVCGMLRKAGMSDAAPSYLPEETWDLILSKRTDEEIVEVAKAKMAVKPGIGLKYIARILMEDPEKPLTDAPGRRRTLSETRSDTYASLTGKSSQNANKGVSDAIESTAVRIAS